MVRIITIVINWGGASVSQLLINRERIFKREYYLISEYKIVNKNVLFTDFSIGYRFFKISQSGSFAIVCP
jgi:hypothetical protein